MVVLELDDAELALERALGRRMDPESGKLFHLEFAPPPGDDPGLLERLAPVHSCSNDAEQIQQRMKAYLVTEPPLRSWLLRFTKLVNSVDAAVPITDLTKRVLEIAKTLEDCKAASMQCRAAATAAAKARAGAEAAAESAAAATAAAAQAAQELLLAKRSELEAAALLRQPPEPAKGAKGKEDPAAAAAAAEAAEAATKLLATEAAARCAEHLKAGVAAQEEAQQHADAAARFAADASAAVECAQRSQHDAERSAAAQAAAAAAATAASEAAEGAVQAADRASASAAAAVQVVASAQGRAAADDITALDADAAADSTGTHAEERLPLADSNAPAQEDPIEGEVAQYLNTLWQQAEAAYLDQAAAAFAGIRSLRQDVISHLSAASAQLLEFLSRGDAKQVEVTKFALHYNAIDFDMLRLPEAKAELMLQADEMRDRLWGICDAKHAENNKLYAALTGAPFADNASTALAAQFVALIQSESDRWLAAVAFVRDYAAFSANAAPPADVPPACDVTAAPDATLAPFFDAKTGVTFPAWIVDSGAPPSVQHAAKLAVALAMLHSRPATDPSADAMQTGKKAGKDKKGKAAAEPELSPADAALAAAVSAVAQPMLEREQEILLNRVRAVLDRATAHTADISAAVSKSHDRLSEALKMSYKQECGVVARVAHIVKEAIDAGCKLPHDVQVSNDVVTIDESALLIAPHAPAPVLPPADKPKEAGLLNATQLAALTADVHAISSCEFVPTRTLAALLHKLAGAAALPAAWERATYKQLRDALSCFDAHQSSYLDWLHVLSSLLLMSFPRIQAAPPDVFAAAAAALHAAGRDGDGMLTEAEWHGCALWFEAPLMRPGCDEDLEADFAVRDVNDAVPVFNEAAALKHVLWSMFSKVRTVLNGRDSWCLSCSLLSLCRAYRSRQALRPRWPPPRLSPVRRPTTTDLPRESRREGQAASGASTQSCHCSTWQLHGSRCMRCARLLRFLHGSLAVRHASQLSSSRARCTRTAPPLARPSSRCRTPWTRWLR